MTVDTKSVSGRRKVRYDCYDDLLGDLNALASCETQRIGNWSLAQICGHLAASLDASIDGIPFRAPLPMRLFGKLFLKKRLLHRGVPSGFKIPSKAKDQFMPSETLDQAEQIERLRAAIERVKTDKTRTSHPFLGDLTTEEWDQFNLRHAEMHLSFVKPAS